MAEECPISWIRMNPSAAKNCFLIFIMLVYIVYFPVFVIFEIFVIVIPTKIYCYFDLRKIDFFDQFIKTCLILF